MIDSRELQELAAGVKKTREMLPVIVAGAVFAAFATAAAAYLLWPAVSAMIARAQLEEGDFIGFGAMTLFPSLALFCLREPPVAVQVVAMVGALIGLILLGLGAAVGCDGPFILMGGGACR